VIKKHVEGFDWENEPIDGHAIYASGGEMQSVVLLCENEIRDLTIIVF
jgi:hypothetical protein